MSQEFNPRVLIVTEFAPGTAGGGWVLVKQLLRGLDWNQVYWWSFFKPTAQALQFGGRHHSCGIPARLSPNRRWKTLKGRALEDIAVPYAARDLTRYIHSVQPDFILFLAHRWAIPVVHQVMPRIKANWHLALHDMPDTADFVENLGEERSARFMKYLDEMYIAVRTRAVIGPGMAEDMRQRTGVACSNFFRCAVEPEILEKLAAPATKSPPTDAIRIGYAGTIVVESTFAILVKALQAVRQRLNRPVEIHLYSWHSYKDREWFDPSVVIEHGPRSEAEIYERFQELTWGLAIMNLNDDDPRYNRLSFPCKFTAALAAGLPLICLGNRKSALIELAKNYRLGLLLTDEDIDQLPDKLCEGLTDFSQFDAYRAEILRCAETEFNAARNRQQLREMMRKMSPANS